MDRGGLSAPTRMGCAAGAASGVDSCWTCRRRLLSTAPRSGAGAGSRRAVDIDGEDMEDWIRRARSGDEAGLARVHVEGWRWGFRGLLPEDYLAGLDQQACQRRWQHMIGVDVRHRETWLALRVGQVVGFCGFGVSRTSGPGQGEGELFSLYLCEEWAGKGIGRALCAAALERMQARGARRGVLWVLEDNARARRFYDLAGWRADGARRQHPLADFEVSEVRYQIDLAGRGPGG